MQAKELSSIDELRTLKAAYLQSTTAPLDGMWLHGFVPMATHYGLFDGNDLGGFYCVDGDCHLLQFMLTPAHRRDASAVFELVTQGNGGDGRGAFASTAEPAFLSLCLDHYEKFEVHTLISPFTLRTVERLVGSSRRVVTRTVQ